MATAAAAAAAPNSNDNKPQIIDDKSGVCIQFILEQLRTYTSPHPPSRPFIIGLNGVQGVGKTTLVKALASALRDSAGLETLVVSLDDFYLRHADQVALASSQPENALVQVRGEPGTHDMELAKQFFTALCEGKPTSIPQYDKSAHGGQGDRVPEAQWERVNAPGQPRVRVVIFEGWSVGFRALAAAEVQARWEAPSSRTLRDHQLEHLLFVNDRLADYDAVTDRFDAFIHIDAEDTAYVYDWRRQQEQRLREEKGAGMTDEQVVRFVDAYYPAYELFSDKLRSGLFGVRGRQLRLVVGRDRGVKQTILL
ncbi:P-loop containing nucleoside triphosphate hydrolase protein [Xylariomycetidae sp. FL2044]|nr:P-loop containing nucleoside triphosphate hydrolase protein [Xylariomycetidae sp. FL2044]